MNRKIILFLTISLTIVFCCYLPTFRAAFSGKSSLKTIVIDPGHGGVDGGTVGISGVEEKSLNLEISTRLADLIPLFGYQTLMTRTEDVSLHSDVDSTIRAQKISDMKKRVDLVNNSDCTCLISIHLNHYPQENCKGAQVFYSDSFKSKELAESVQLSLKNGIDKDNNRGVKKADNIYLLSNISCPGILVECGFLSNYEEEKLLQQEEYQKKIALSVMVGFLNANENF